MQDAAQTQYVFALADDFAAYFWEPGVTGAWEKQQYYKPDYFVQSYCQNENALLPIACRYTFSEDGSRLTYLEEAD